MKKHKIIIAGFGGQGVMSAGSIIAYMGMMEGKKTSWFPMYGPEKRGGTAACHTIISENLIGSPVIENPEVLIVFNEPSLDKYEEILLPGGTLIMDNSFIKRKTFRTDINLVQLPATKMASEMGNITFANIIVIGAFISTTDILSGEHFENALSSVLPQKKHYMIPQEVEAFNIGLETIK